MDNIDQIFENLASGVCKYFSDNPLIWAFNFAQKFFISRKFIAEIQFAAAPDPIQSPDLNVLEDCDMGSRRR